MISIDRYTFTARFLPSLIVVLPAAAALLPWAPFEVDWYKLATSGAVGLVAAYFIAQLTRDAGKGIEPALWASWGGPPTTTMMRFSDERFDDRQTRELHAKFRAAKPDLYLPDAEEEQRDPAAADGCYERAVAWLKANTRGKAFPLLFEENIAYGFRRNLFALRGFAFLACVAGLTAGGLASKSGKPCLVSLFVAAITLIYLLFQSEAGIRRQAIVYAERLFEALDTRPSEQR